jgi:cysteinyl-tRNA synthetase
MQMNFFNTLTRSLQHFEPSEKSRVKLYTCGPTVYNHVHIGNLRAFIAADILKRALEFNGYDVDWVMNITDLDDKTIANTIKESGSAAGIADLEKFTQKYFDTFLQDLKKINVEEQDISFVKVTEKIADIQLYILELIKRGFAYKAEDGSTYFSIEKYQQKFSDYGALVGEKFLEGKKIGRGWRLMNMKKKIFQTLPFGRRTAKTTPKFSGSTQI